jgi:hypothetical protein
LNGLLLAASRRRTGPAQIENGVKLFGALNYIAERKRNAQVENRTLMKLFHGRKPNIKTFSISRTKEVPQAGKPGSS